jgi:hypothetical protein
MNFILSPIKFNERLYQSLRISLKGVEKIQTQNLKRYFSIAMGASSELEYLLLLACDLGYLPKVAHLSIQSDLIETRKMLNAFIQKLKANSQLLNAAPKEIP